MAYSGAIQSILPRFVSAGANAIDHQVGGVLVQRGRRIFSCVFCRRGNGTAPPAMFPALVAEGCPRARQPTSREHHLTALFATSKHLLEFMQTRGEQGGGGFRRSRSRKRIASLPALAFARPFAPVSA